MVRSESEVLNVVIRKLWAAHDAHEQGNVRAMLRSAINELQSLERQAARGYHRNPALVVYGNPPMNVDRRFRTHNDRSFEVAGVISEEVHAILYRHIEDGKPYRHDFDHPTTLLAVKRAGKDDVLMTSPDGFPIWQDF